MLGCSMTRIHAKINLLASNWILTPCSLTSNHCSFFFFSSRRRHTRLQGDWSSDVCSSDLPARVALHGPLEGEDLHAFGDAVAPDLAVAHGLAPDGVGRRVQAQRLLDDPLA